MKTLESPADLRMVSKLLQLLKSDHGINISAQSPKLTELLDVNITMVEDPVIDAIWLQLRPKLMDGVDAPKASLSADKTDSAAEEPPKKNGKYIVYRGKKTWVENK